MTAIAAPSLEPLQPTALDPEVTDLSIYVMAGRTRDPAPALQQGIDAERLGFRGVWLSERYDLKDAGVMLGGIAARTTRLKIGASAIACATRSPLLIASLSATMHAMYGGRFILGLGRTAGEMLRAQGIPVVTFEAFADYVDILRRLFRGESIVYDGPAGRFDGMQTVDTIPNYPPPEIWSVNLGGPKACKLAAQICDGVMLTPFLTPEAVQRAVNVIRTEAERAGRDPQSIRICHPIVTAPDMDETDTMLLAHCRAITYLVGTPDVARAYQKLNGWDSKTIFEDLHNHPLFQNPTLTRASADQNFHRSDLLGPASLLPDEWMRETCALGSTAECVKQLKVFKELGVDELAFYGSNPVQNAALVAAWRDEPAQ